jgi:aspartate aminotransferase/aminotransferase
VLNAAISDDIHRRYGCRPPALFTTAGVSGGLALSHLALVDAGDEVLLPDPYFVMYKNVLEIVGARPRFYDLYPAPGRRAWHPDVDEIKSLIGPRTKAIILNTPGNPTGGVLGESELAAIVEVAERAGTWIIADEIYSLFCYDVPFASILPLQARYPRILALGGFSKTYGVPGWRLGWVAGPSQVVEAMKLLQQYTFVCAPAPLQHGALAALSVDMSAKRDLYRAKRDRVVAKLGGVYDLQPSEGSFYAFVAYPSGLDEATFVSRCLERRLLIVPGSSFSRRATHFRLSFAASDEMLERGLDVLLDVAGA